MYCPNCGKQIPDTVKFCPFCGSPVHVKEQGNPAGFNNQNQYQNQYQNQNTYQNQNAYQNQNYQQYGQPQRPNKVHGPEMSDTIKYFSYAFMVVFAIVAVVNAWSLIQRLLNIRYLIDGFSFFGISGVVRQIFAIVLGLVNTAVFIFGAAVMFLQARNGSRENYETYFNAMLVFSVIALVISIISCIMFYGYRILLPVIAILAGIGLFILLLYLDDVNIADFYRGKNFMDELSASLKGLSGEINQAKKAYEASHPEQAQQAQQKQNASYQAAQAHVILKTNRGIISYFLLTLITCGIYQLYWVHCVARDVNIACFGDGKNTGGAAAFFFFGILTCGIYDIYWWYALADRTQAIGITRYNLYMQHGGGSVLLWMLFGWLICGLGELIGLNHAIQNVNMVCLAYNQQGIQGTPRQGNYGTPVINVNISNPNNQG